jgi:hypothetical protein
MQQPVPSPSTRSRAIALACGVLSLLVTTASPCRGEGFHNGLSLQGYTGLLNTPNAAVTDEGKFYALYANQIEPELRSRTPRQESYIFSVGFFSFAEAGGRLTDLPGIAGGLSRGESHLSANFKVKVPFIPKGYYLPDLAFGTEDLGGATHFFRTKYLVASEELWRLRLSAGYGFGPDRMKGVFGGVELKAFDWLYLIGENDTKETNLGVRLVSPEFFGIPVNLQVTAKTSLDHRPGSDYDFAFGFQFPLGSDHHNTTPLPAAEGEGRSPAPAESGGAKVPAPPAEGGGAPLTGGETVGVPAAPLKESKAAQINESPRLALLAERLTAGGFQNVRVGSRGDELLVVEYENSRFNHNELDALGVVSGTVVDTIPSGFRTLRLITRKKGIRVLQLSAPLADFRAFLRDAHRYDEFNERLEITGDVAGDDGVSFVDGDANPSWLHSSLVAYPALKTFVGTEVGNFDYLLSAKLDYFLNTWKGSVVNARWDIPVAWSKNFDDGQTFRDRRNPSRIERLMLFQAIKLTPTLMANLGGGMVLHDKYGTINELVWSPGSGEHRFTFRQAYASTNDIREPEKKNEVYLGSYRYYFSPLDLYCMATGGRFFDNDTGFRIDLKRYFGDTAFTVYYKNSRTTAGELAQVGGAQVTFPLTPRRDMKPYLVQVRGNDEWSYAQETKIVSQGGTNFVSTSIGVDPEPAFNVERVFYNRDRLSESYIRRHLLRLRDAYLTYR